MRITVDLDDSLLEELLRIMGEKKKAPAVSKAVLEYVKRRKARELGRLLREGSFDYPLTNEDVEKEDA